MEGGVGDGQVSWMNRGCVRVQQPARCGLGIKVLMRSEWVFVHCRIVRMHVSSNEYTSRRLQRAGSQTWADILAALTAIEV